MIMMKINGRRLTQHQLADTFIPDLRRKVPDDAECFMYVFVPHVCQRINENYVFPLRDSYSTPSVVSNSRRRVLARCMRTRVAPSDACCIPAISIMLKPLISN